MGWKRNRTEDNWKLLAVNSPGVTPGQPVFLPHLLNAELLGTVASCEVENRHHHR